jgi:phage repressor protein C with HTH and peptisase S24 domain
LARKIGYDLGVYVAVEDGTARASERMIDKICEVIAVDKEELMSGSDAPLIMDESGRTGTFGATPDVQLPPGSYARYVPRLSWAQAGALDSGHVDEGYDYEGVISIDIKDRRAFGLRIRGDSMTPEIREGDDAIVCPTWQPRNGDTVIARTVDGDVMCKIYQTKEGGTKIVLSSYNPAHPPIELSREEIAWIYPVGQVVRNYRKQ